MRTATVFFALAAALASAQDDKKSPVEEFGIIVGNVESRDRSKLKIPLCPFLVLSRRAGPECFAPCDGGTRC
ncbi:hypothetical protein IMZ48_16550 [Candidatus Bathyarchaeota archaeon]|nr:hypothetical protein [Candidatus Bathyarchaeota archaeon]